jgi:thiamine pyrophosphate-dependent acetolactate synthase large subunit-like protein
MGFGVPSALGAKLGRPDKTVIDIDGDGSFMMTQTEMATCAEFDIRVKILLLNNDFQGMVRQWQDLFYEERYSGTAMVNPDFVKLAEAMHCAGLRCRTRKGKQIHPVLAPSRVCAHSRFLDAGRAATFLIVDVCVLQTWWKRWRSS